MPRPVRRYPAKVMRKVFNSLKERIEKAGDPLSLEKLRKALERAYEKRAIPTIGYRKLKLELEQKARAPRYKRVKTMLEKRARPRFTDVFGPSLEHVKNLLEKHIAKNPKVFLKISDEWERYQIAYQAYVRGTEFEALFRVFNRAAENELKRRGITPRVIRAVKNRYAWSTFHIGMRDLIRSFGYENVVSLANMFERASRKGIKILNFYPHKEWALLHVEIPFEGRTIREVVAIEEMEKGKIKKLGDPVKYMVPQEYLDMYFESGRWFEEAREPELAERYEAIKKALNELLEKR